MPSPFINRTLAGARVLKRLPGARLLTAAEVLRLARDHVGKLEPKERRRVVELLRRARGRPANLTARERRELAALVARAEPRMFLKGAVQKVTGVPVPNASTRQLWGKRRS